MHHILAPQAGSDPALPAIPVRVDRATLRTKAWQGAADDGTPFRFQLDAPLRHGQAFFQSCSARYVIAQQPEPLLEVGLAIAPSAAAGIGWALGNAHREVSAEATRLLTPDEPETRTLLERLQVPFSRVTGIFQPGRFARGSAAPGEFGAGHRH